MMPSVIPARLQYRCGHAALVTLPRVKGETATQRNDRVAREKSAALLRECDFCAPANGNNHVAAPALVETAPVLETVVPDVEPVAEPLTEPVVQALAEVAAEPAAEAVAEPSPAAEAAEAEPRLAPTTNGVPTPKPARKPRLRRQHAPSAAELARGRRFLVEYRMERVLRADTIRDALRQVASFGPADVVAITRED